jgi:hypothetical protein
LRQRERERERERVVCFFYLSVFLCVQGYTNDDNPFGDANLLKPFVWHKKREREGTKNMTEQELMERDRARMMENRRELEKVKKRRQVFLWQQN